ncbi:MAG TPA: alpha/beta hydrolase [Roseimicrobium sp.]|nr:alpha/beta hydrolase [Roseimicrobium sp.]
MKLKSVLVGSLLLAPMFDFDIPAAEAKKPDPVAVIAETLTPDRKIVYKKVGERELQMHVFLPKDWKTSDRRPCFLTIHGGGWTGGEPKRMYPFAAHYRDLGMVGISLQYRLSTANSGVTVFDCVHDARSAARYIKEHAAELGVDADKLIVNGGSAGGHLAAATAMFDAFNDPSDNLKTSPTPVAMVLNYPVIDTSEEGYGFKKIGARWKEISPLHQVKKGTPPAILFHGTGDKTTPFKGAKAFHEAMLASGNRCELVVNEGGIHGYLMFDEALYKETLQKSDAFLTSLGLLPVK